MNRVLIIGCGDIGLRVAQLLRGRYRLLGLARSLESGVRLRAAGIVPVYGDLDDAHSLQRLAGLAHIVLHLAPPPNTGERDTRTRNLLAALAHGSRPHKLIYISTSGVYGDCAGEMVTETRPLNAQSPRAQRRVDAERQIRMWSRRNGYSAGILRVPGIYAADRLPLERLRGGTPAIEAAQDNYTNHIHADDLARIVLAALRYAKSGRVVNASDDSDMKMGEYFDVVADAHGLPRPLRLPREEVQQSVTPSLWSFMNESRRLTNTRLKQELKFRLRHPTVEHGTSLMRR